MTSNDVVAVGLCIALTAGIQYMIGTMTAIRPEATAVLFSDQLPEGLAEVVSRWDSLPDTVRSDILKKVREEER